MQTERYCVFDTEGSAAEDDYKGCAIVSDDHSAFYLERSKALAVLADHARRGYILAAHNAEYDIMVLLWPAGCDVKLEYYSHKLSAALWKYDPNQPAARIIDSLGLAAGLSVASLGEALKLPKLETPQRLLGIDPDKYHWRCERHLEWECVTCYALRDAEIVHLYLNSLRDYLEQWELPVRRKLGGIAVRVWDKLDDHGDVRLRAKRIETIARQAYHGGRVEAFVYGKVQGVHVYDVKSMYPSVMLNAPMPDMRELRMFEFGPVSPHYLQYEGVSDATVTIPQMHVPPLPVEHSERLYFPVGTVRSVFSNVELRMAQQQGCTIRTIHRMAFSPTVVYPFTQYVTILAEQRRMYKQSKDSREQVVKILMNALYGRLGLTRDQEMDVVRPLSKSEKLNDCVGQTASVIGNRIAVRKTKEIHRPSPHSNVLWASQITAYARVRLLSHMQQAGTALLYCDTDGVYTTTKCLDTGDQLGDLEYRGFYDTGDFHGPKLYRLEGGDEQTMVRAKGVPRHFADTYLSAGAVEYRQPGRVLQAFRQDVEPSVWHIVHKEQNLVPAKRQVHNVDLYRSGVGFSTTSPLVFADSEPETPFTLL